MKAEITAAVFADTHANVSLMLEAIARLRPDAVIHLGDHEKDTAYIRERFPGLPLYCVRGNCDLASCAPDSDTVQLGPVKAFITHGHLYNVRWGTDSLVYAAMEAGAKIAMYGHTHEALLSEVAGVTVLNPGTAGKGRDLTCALVTVYENGAFTCDIRNL